MLCVSLVLNLSVHDVDELHRAAIFLSSRPRSSTKT